MEQLTKFVSTSFDGGRPRRAWTPGEDDAEMPKKGTSPPPSSPASRGSSVSPLVDPEDSRSLTPASVEAAPQSPRPSAVAALDPPADLESRWGWSEVSVEQRRNEGAGDPRESPPTSGIVRHDSHLQNPEWAGRGSNPVCLGGRGAV
ncbi:hypothetical protein PR048_026076 [Dryococelus australis]|uniref:Uncharacterized protein n=1 Tax=Dryococelus australis TaxID=614101 RepID=A0ABQ9GKB9_9NEOP|nr:hypothetical protein PR048_026076 [Dryococelus australis]